MKCRNCDECAYDEMKFVHPKSKRVAWITLCGPCMDRINIGVIKIRWTNDKNPSQGCWFEYAI